MEIILNFIVIFMLLLSIWMNFAVYKKFLINNLALNEFHSNLVSAITDQTEKYSHTQNKIDAMASGLERSMLALRDNLEPTKPIKLNNWDSMREAFKGPTRIDVNERN